MSRTAFIKSISHSTEAKKDEWQTLMNSSKLINSKRTKFPEVEQCRLRMTYSKLEGAKNKSFYNKVDNLQGLKGSLLLDKPDKNLQYLKLNKTRHQNIFNKRYQHTSSFEKYQQSFDTKSKTIDLAQLKKQTMIYFRTKQDPQNTTTRNKQNRKSEEFNEYFKKVVLNQRASYQLSKFYSQGKGLDIKNRAQFQKLQRLNLTNLNKTIEQKQMGFRCESTKMNFFDPQLTPPKCLPEIPTPRKIKITEKKKNKSQKLQKTRPKEFYQFTCSPWESDNSVYEF